MLAEPMKKHLFYYRVTKVSLVLFFIADCLNKVIYLITEDDTPNVSPSLLARMAFEFIAVIFILADLNRKKSIFVILSSLLFISFLIGVAFYLRHYDKRYEYFYHLGLFNKYLFAFIAYYFISELRNNKELITKLQGTCERIFIINSLLAIVGAIFRIQLFKSYLFMDYRYGYNGVIPAVNESSLFYFIALSFVYYKKFILGKKLKWSWLIIVASFLIGTKAIYLFIAALVLFHFLRVSSITNKILALLGITVFIAITAFLYISDFASPVVDYFVYLISEKGLESALLSGRDVYLQTRFFENQEYWNFFNYLFGGQDQLNYLIEMDLFDVVLFFGAVGSILYFVIFFRSIFSISFRKKFNIFFVVVYFIMAGLGGHYFASALNALYLVIFCLFIYNSDLKEPGAKASHQIVSV
jgi:hypothetical protein